ncbi:toll/interleukin-1 receptor domain-containing protein [Chitinophaga varians]|uniref:toll/interleukin-1 receptor domain-containing protein n=1 Tax=Chitinophaga varians TaxID=2202339 RepID=UPI00165FF4B6|nr:toll/interleukin-1 receptor domain-containing protein [Chitinophaga varians]MBC9911041.1 toll/interleukin-1 receptor domain-containing protein [Chitinophaga varians]
MKFYIVGSSISAESEDEKVKFNLFCNALGRCLANINATLNLCSPYEDSADYQLLQGIGQLAKVNLEIKLYFPATNEIRTKWNELLVGMDDISVEKFPQESALTQEKIDRKYAWLFSQIQAVKNSNYVFVIGGNTSGASNLLARVADMEDSQVIPFPQFKGVGEIFFNKKYYQLLDNWGKNFVDLLGNNDQLEKVIHNLMEPPITVDPQTSRKADKKIYFISYAKKRNSEADFLETLLRRRNLNVIRDENDFIPGTDVSNAIMESIAQCDVFIALWCCEYACSPWCFDELHKALESNKKNGKEIWILSLDRTRMVHPEARKMLMYDAFTRDSLEAKILSLLGR